MLKKHWAEVSLLVFGLGVLVLFAYVITQAQHAPRIQLKLVSSNQYNNEFGETFTLTQFEVTTENRALNNTDKLVMSCGQTVPPPKVHFDSQIIEEPVFIGNWQNLSFQRMITCLVDWYDSASQPIARSVPVEFVIEAATK